MADTKISADPVATLVGTETIPCIQGGVNKRTTPNAIAALATPGITGTGTAGQVALWDGTSSQTGDAGLTYAAGALTISGQEFVGTATPGTDFFSQGALNVFTGNVGGVLVSDTSGAVLEALAAVNVISGNESGIPAMQLAENSSIFSDAGYSIDGILNVGMDGNAVGATWFNADTSGNRDYVQHFFGSFESPTISAKGTFEFQNSGLGTGDSWFGFNFAWENVDIFMLASDGSFLPGDSNAQDIGNPSSSITGAPALWRTGYFGTSVVTPIIESTPVALASLGSATGVYKRAMISDGLTLGTWGAAAVDGGVVVKPVWSNGVAWLNG